MVRNYLSTAVVSIVLLFSFTENSNSVSYFLPVFVFSGITNRSDMISTRLHGILDYSVAIVLLAFPWLFSVAGITAETIVPVSLGIATILYSLCTRYEWGEWKILPMRIHLLLDLVNAIILAVSPLWFGYIDRIYL